MKWHYTFKEWKHLLYDSLHTLARAVLMILWLIISSLTSIFFYAYQKISDFCKREFLPSMIILVVGTLLVTCWCLTFANERAHRKTAEHQRDSIAFVLSKFTQAYPSDDDIVYKGDTISYEK